MAEERGLDQELEADFCLGSNSNKHGRMQRLPGSEASQAEDGEGWRKILSTSMTFHTHELPAHCDMHEVRQVKSASVEGGGAPMGLP